MNFALCGETIDIIVKLINEADFEDIGEGHVICSVAYPIPFVKKFRAVIYTLKMNHPIIPGNRFNFQIGL